MVGPQLRRIRREQDLSQEQLAERSGVSRWTINAIERGRSEPRLATLAELATALGVEITALMPEGMGGNPDTEAA